MIFRYLLLLFSGLLFSSGAALSSDSFLKHGPFWVNQSSFISHEIERGTSRDYLRLRSSDGKIIHQERLETPPVCFGVFDGDIVFSSRPDLEASVSYLIDISQPTNQGFTLRNTDIPCERFSSKLADDGSTVFKLPGQDFSVYQDRYVFTDSIGVNRTFTRPLNERGISDYSFNISQGKYSTLIYPRINSIRMRDEKFIQQASFDFYGVSEEDEVSHRALYLTKEIAKDIFGQGGGYRVHHVTGNKYAIYSSVSGVWLAGGGSFTQIYDGRIDLNDYPFIPQNIGCVLDIVPRISKNSLPLMSQILLIDVCNL